jgi:hypothetical protein
MGVYLRDAKFVEFLGAVAFIGVGVSASLAHECHCSGHLPNSVCDTSNLHGACYLVKNILFILPSG